MSWFKCACEKIQQPFIFRIVRAVYTQYKPIVETTGPWQIIEKGYALPYEYKYATSSVVNELSEFMTDKDLLIKIVNALEGLGCKIEINPAVEARDAYMEFKTP